MGIAISMLSDVDNICGQFATALHNSEAQVYVTLTFLLIVGVWLFPPKNDADQA